VKKAAREHSLDQALLQAMIAAESGFDRTPFRQGCRRPHAAHARNRPTLRVRTLSTRGEYQGGAKYVRDLMRKFNNDLSLTLAAYNAGEDAIIQYGHRIPPYRETLQYVPRVLTLYRQYQRNVR
jgi:soluble lytic murein transglycosylase-like protein